MDYQIFKSDSRGGANHGWLNTRHSYSFANYYDPNRIHFGALRVVNDDIITGGMVLENIHTIIWRLLQFR